MSVSNTLKQRGARYGKFIEHAEIAQGIQAAMAKSRNWNTLDYDIRQCLCVISDKIARILNGDPYYTDNYHDIQGYAKLVEDRLLELENQPEESLFEPESSPSVDYEPIFHPFRDDEFQPSDMYPTNGAVTRGGVITS